MRLIDLDPRWIMDGDHRIGFVFRSPIRRDEWQSCFPNPPSVGEQIDHFERILADDIAQPCRVGAHWTIVGGIEAATFETMTVTPSLDGSAGGLWHGHITNGEIVGGI
ncbi:MAG: hypothetical protein U9R73_00430 [Pseudomonadota bacterium]|nr:hypothetical protein [Pseudomonadota bacterium]